MPGVTGTGLDADAVVAHVEHVRLATIDTRSPAVSFVRIRLILQPAQVNALQ